MPESIDALLALIAAAERQAGDAPSADPSASQEAAALDAQSARFVPVDLAADLSGLAQGERDALAHLIRAAEVIDAIYLTQVWSGNAAMLARLVRDGSPIGRSKLRAFLIHRGPWSRLDHDAPFVPEAPAKPLGANFYPPDATREEIEAWLARLPPAERARATGFFTTIRRGADGRLIAVPYSDEYRDALGLAAAHLRRSAVATADPTLAAFLRARADAFASNDYYASDVRWLELESRIEPTIGPYEVYEDQWFNYKAAFEAFITVKEPHESAALQRFAARLQDIEDHLPMDPTHRNPRLGAMAPIAVVNTVFSAGDGRRGVQAAAFNLPNDERIIREKGSKRVMLKNTQWAKFHHVLLPIVDVALAPADRGRVSFDAFFTHILMHELMHGLGPHDIVVNGRATTVRQELKDTYSAIEEAKADISGLFAMQFLIDGGHLDSRLEAQMYVTFLASAFRSMRFGINEAHGLGQAIQLNFLLDAGAFVVHADGTFGVDPSRTREGVGGLAREILMIEAEGRHDRAQQLIASLGVLRPETAAVLRRLGHVPVDIAPRFVSAAARP